MALTSSAFMCIRQSPIASTHISVRFFSVQYVSVVLVSVRCDLLLRTQKNVVPIETTENRTTGVQKGYKNVLPTQLTIWFLMAVVIE